MGIYVKPVFLSSKQRPSSQFSGQSLGLPARCQSNFGSVGFQDPYHRTVPVTADPHHRCLLHCMICNKYLSPQMSDVGKRNHTPGYTSFCRTSAPFHRIAGHSHHRRQRSPSPPLCLAILFEQRLGFRNPKGIINTCVYIIMYIYIEIDR